MRAFIFTSTSAFLKWEVIHALPFSALLGFTHVLPNHQAGPAPLFWWAHQLRSKASLPKKSPAFHDEVQSLHNPRRHCAS